MLFRSGGAAAGTPKEKDGGADEGGATAVGGADDSSSIPLSSSGSSIAGAAPKPPKVGAAAGAGAAEGALKARGEGLSPFWGVAGVVPKLKEGEAVVVGAVGLKAKWEAAALVVSFFCDTKQSAPHTVPWRNLLTSPSTGLLPNIFPLAPFPNPPKLGARSEEHTSELQSQ